MKRALLINDSKFESLILKDMLSHLDYDVELADEYDAMYQVEQFLPDLVIANYIMKETRGDELIGLIKDRDETVVCLLSSNSPIHVKDFPDASIDGILRTPVSMFTLTDLLRRVYSNNEFDYKPSIMTETTHAKHRYCPHCNKDISSFSDQILYCPFCGDEIDRMDNDE